MADLIQQKADDDHRHKEDQCNTNDGNTSSLIDQIYKQLVCTVVFHYIDYPWDSKSVSVRLDDVLFIHIFLIMPLRNLVDSNKFYATRTYIYTIKINKEKSIF